MAFDVPSQKHCGGISSCRGWKWRHSMADRRIICIYRRGKVDGPNAERRCCRCGRQTMLLIAFTNDVHIFSPSAWKRRRRRRNLRSPMLPVFARENRKMIDGFDAQQNLNCSISNQLLGEINDCTLVLHSAGLAGAAWCVWVCMGHIKYAKDNSIAMRTDKIYESEIIVWPKMSVKCREKCKRKMHMTKYADVAEVRECVAVAPRRRKWFPSVDTCQRKINEFLLSHSHKALDPVHSRHLFFSPKLISSFLFSSHSFVLYKVNDR